MRVFDVPFLPDEEYLAFLGLNLARIHSLHFSLYDADAPDARHRTEIHSPQRLAALLGRLPGPRKYLLVNSRFHAARFYEASSAAAGGLGGLLRSLETLLEAGALHGLVFADYFLLQALSDASPELCRALEAVPSINCQIDSAEKALLQLDAIGRTQFRPPAKLLLDRNVNRRIFELRAMAQALRAALPNVAITLMANEGCLYQCPFKPAHDALIAADCASGAHYAATAPVRALGCVRVYAEAPERLFQSPFIRPEDLDMYADIADVAKLCGRTQGPAVMKRIVAAYFTGGYAGNLLELMDAMEGLADVLEIPNAALPHDFCSTVAHCDKRCAACGYCRELAARFLIRRGPTLKPYR